MKVEITLVNPHAELRRDLPGYRLTFKYAYDNDDHPTALNECSTLCYHPATCFCRDFFSMEGLWKNCFPDFTKVQTYKYHSGTYPTPFNGMNGGVFDDDTEHSKDMTVVKTCALLPEAVHEISTVCPKAFYKLVKYAEEFEKTHDDIQIKFVM